ncbi:MAG: TIGR01777 family oxidoreductase [Spirochaetia bacterium]|nr:TIGR01777 family oxidoreductase [Spirochaetia bacterium]
MILIKGFANSGSEARWDMIVAITGGTGLIGRHLTALLERKGVEVRILSRRPDAAVQWDPGQHRMSPGALDGVHAVVHLAGESVAGRWTEEKKAQINQSRRQAAEFLAEQIKAANLRPVVVSASAIGYYGDRGQNWLSESDGSGSGFLAETTVAWEASLGRLTDVASRNVVLRIGVVLASQGGALPQMAAPVRMGMGSALGSGEQFVSWIHIDDLVRLFAIAIDRTLDKSAILSGDLSGVYNAVAPLPVTNAELLQAIAATLGKPFFLPRVPGFVLKLILGQMSDMVLDSTRVASDRISSTGFTFQFPQLQSALSSLLKN